MLWARVSASPVPEDDGSGKVGVLAMLVDVTDRVLTDEALHRSEARFRRLSESGMIGVAVLDADGRATEANDEFLRLVGGDRDDLANGHLARRRPGGELDGLWRRPFPIPESPAQARLADHGLLRR